MNARDLTSWLEASREAARRGAAILESWRAKFSVREKGRADLVTEADLASQQEIRSYLLNCFPDHDFLGEEGGKDQPRPGPKAPPTWIVDPLDGTTNYVHDCPAYCVSIGLEVGGELVVGTVYDPRQDEMFSAASGLGATLNDRPLRVSATSELETALLATGFPADMRGQDYQIDWFRYFSRRARSIRRTGSTALNMAYVAAGRFDGFWAFDNNAWDVAGGVVLIREAGGLVTNMRGEPYDPHTRPCVASHGQLHAEMLQAFREGPRDAP